MDRALKAAARAETRCGRAWHRVWRGHLSSPGSKSSTGAGTRGAATSGQETLGSSQREPRGREPDPGLLTCAALQKDETQGRKGQGKGPQVATASQAAAGSWPRARATCLREACGSGGPPRTAPAQQPEGRGLGAWAAPPRGQEHPISCFIKTPSNARAGASWGAPASLARSHWTPARVTVSKGLKVWRACRRQSHAKS